jgi:hypothetical protein
MIIIIQIVLKKNYNKKNDKNQSKDKTTICIK